MVHKMHPDYALAIEHITEYYDMKLATFGLDSDGSMVVAFPVFVKDHASEPKVLHEIEMVKVPIPDQNKEADSYSEVKYSTVADPGFPIGGHGHCRRGCGLPRWLCFENFVCQIKRFGTLRGAHAGCTPLDLPM